jgi:hypothetical protein
MPGMALFVALAFAVPSHAQEARSYPQQAWHVSPAIDPMSSTLYQIIAWERIKKIQIGMPESKVESLLGAKPQFYHHPINAIFFSTTPQGQLVEVALKRGKFGVIEAISDKRLPSNDD